MGGFSVLTLADEVQAFRSGGWTRTLLVVGRDPLEALVQALLDARARKRDLRDRFGVEAISGVVQMFEHTDLQDDAAFASSRTSSTSRCPSPNQWSNGGCLVSAASRAFVPQVVAHASAGDVVHGERLRLSPRAVERDHQLLEEPLTPRVARNLLEELLEGLEAAFLEHLDLRCDLSRRRPVLILRGDIEDAPMRPCLVRRPRRPSRPKR